ncbi:MAG: hypothetical protein E6J16_09150 [Chloroflexota bacterium]|nr:MAG: hypothetical protein E6J16_09150 [Chloroflexota bacterium]
MVRRAAWRRRRRRRPTRVPPKRWDVRRPAREPTRRSRAARHPGPTGAPGGHPSPAARRRAGRAGGRGWRGRPRWRGVRRRPAPSH